jgi:hypothetical protein
VFFLPSRRWHITDSSKRRLKQVSLGSGIASAGLYWVLIASDPEQSGRMLSSLVFGLSFSALSIFLWGAQESYLYYFASVEKRRDVLSIKRYKEGIKYLKGDQYKAMVAVYRKQFALRWESIQKKDDQLTLDNVQQGDFKCPISRDILACPVKLPDENDYNEKDIRSWYFEGNNKCPLNPSATFEGPKDWVLNQELVDDIETYLKKQEARLGVVYSSDESEEDPNGITISYRR